jgi:hypothetical protein
MTNDSLFEPAEILRSLKDFQVRTVRHAFRRLYECHHSSRRFLVADEVGLGKTLVARGIIAKTIRHLQEQNAKRIDIVYVCSNAAIAQQNVNKLNVTGLQEYSVATRLTLLPLELRNLNSRKLNFVSFTPGVAFELSNGTGARRERMLLYRVLMSLPNIDRSGLRNLMQVGVTTKRWRQDIKEPLEYEQSLMAEFVRHVVENATVSDELYDLCNRFHRHRESWPSELKTRRNALIGELRQLLARDCLKALQPDLVILDEFQRFKNLLGDDTAAGQLAQQLMNYEGVRVLMLSATPYKMLTMYGEEENHYEDFLQTLSFLFKNDKHLAKLREALERYRQALYSSADSGTGASDELRKILLRVMVRTERVPSTRDRDAMVKSPPVETTLKPEDLHRASALDQLTTAIGAQEAIEYWKSAPYLLNFMKGYKLKVQFEAHLDSKSLAAPMAAMEPHLLSKQQIQRYEAIDPGNSRLRALVDHTLSNEEWRKLWLPPSLPYVSSKSDEQLNGMTKSLVFSTWNVVPDVIASVCSYHAERERVLLAGSVDYFDLHEVRNQLLVFRKTGDRVESMSTLMMLYPSPILARKVDPMMIAYKNKEALSAEGMRNEAHSLLAPLAGRMTRIRHQKADNRADQAWYWAALGTWDNRKFDEVRDWAAATQGWRSLLHKKRGTTDSSLFTEHVDHFVGGMDGDVPLGELPKDFHDVLTDMALGSPAICAARALRRVAPDLALGSPEILQASANIAEGFRSLFNSPDVRSLIEKEGVPYWRQVLRHCAENDLQSVLDEYIHSLKESLGLMDIPSDKTVKEISLTIRSVLSLRTSNLEMDDIARNDGKIEITKHKIRCRYALRFGDINDDSEQELQRAGIVREAFNSPFRPFTLASTSVGQEGLDFHTYCHRVWHWNLPRNPVDMEQREGRVNRYKGHAVRKNVARAVGLNGLAADWHRGHDPWKAMFEIARRRIKNSGSGVSELTPFWVFDDVSNPSQVERLVPLPPFSSENAKYKALKKSLVVYRLAFGQPRQEDLLEHLADTLDDEAIDRLLTRQLNLSP